MYTAQWESAGRKIFPACAARPFSQRHKAATQHLLTVYIYTPARCRQARVAFPVSLDAGKLPRTDAGRLSTRKEGRVCIYIYPYLYSLFLCRSTWRARFKSGAALFFFSLHHPVFTHVLYAMRQEELWIYIFIPVVFWFGPREGDAERRCCPTMLLLLLLLKWKRNRGLRRLWVSVHACVSGFGTRVAWF